MVDRGVLQEHFCKHFVKIQEINANFHFSHYKSMETLSCHSNETPWATTIKNIIYVETNVINMSAKFQLHPSYGFWEEDFWIIFWKFTFMLPWQPIKFSHSDKIHMNHRGGLKKHFCRKKKSKNFCSETAKIANFHFSHYKSVETKLPQQPEFLSDWNQNTIIHSLPPTPPPTPATPIDAICEIWKESASEKSFGNVDDGRTTDACLYYKLTYEPSAQVS